MDKKEVTLQNLFISTQPRETAGPISSSRFDFQKDVSLNLLLETEESGKDYIFIFDYHEDLVVMDCELNPEKISFYQIKGKKTGNYTIGALTKPDKDSNGNPLLSIISKLYDSKTKFEKETTSLNILTNARFKIKLNDSTAGESKDEICAIELTDSDKQKLKTCLIDQLNLDTDPIFEEALFFKVVDVSLSDSSRHLKGILADFFEKKYNKTPDVSAIYKNFFAEIKKRSNYNKQINTFEDLLNKKAINKTTFNSWLNSIVNNETTLKEKWIEIFGILQQEGLNWQLIKKLKEGWVKFELLSKDQSDANLQHLIDEVKLKTTNEQIGTNIYESAKQIYDKMYPSINSSFDEPTVIAIILNQLY